MANNTVFGRVKKDLVAANVERLSKLFRSDSAYSIAMAVSVGLLNPQIPFLPRQLSSRA